MIFSRYPEAGKTKTRMIPALGATGAAKLQQQMTEHTLATAKQLQKSRSLSLEIHFAGGDRQLMSEWLGKGMDYHPQVQGDLGQKMYAAFKRAFERESERVIAIGIDCPEIDTSILNQAFEALATRKLVLGGAKDGGYYLIGMERSALLMRGAQSHSHSQSLPMLFNNISWGTSKVLEQTQAIASHLNLEFYSLPLLNDIDRPDDLWIWQRFDSQSSKR